ncbi:hypothetical protein [Dactylosporangium cerinum]
MLRDLISITMFFRHPPQELPWRPADIACLTARYEGLLHEPRWRALVLDHLADPQRPHFHLALRPAEVLGLSPTAQCLARLETGPSLLDPTWAHALCNSDLRHVAHILDLAERRLTTTPDPNATMLSCCSRTSSDAILNTAGPCCAPHSPAARPKRGVSR